MKNILSKLYKFNILTIGDIMLDKYLYGDTNRISPESPTPVVKINYFKNKPGGAANVAMNINSLGMNSYLIGIIGDDENAKILKYILYKKKIKFNLIKIPKHTTTTKLRIISQNQQLIRLDLENKIHIENKQIIQKIKYLLPKIHVLIISDYNKGINVLIDKIINLTKSYNIPILIDPKNCNFKKYKGATLLTPNLLEFEQAVGICKNENEIISKGTKIINDCKLLALLITRSQNGMTLLQLNKKPLYLPAKSKKITSVIGAGDTVISVLAISLAAGNSIEESCYLANIAAGIVVNKSRSSTITLTELQKTILEKT